MSLGAALPYDDPRVRKLIHSFKYDAVAALGEPLGALLARCVRESQILTTLPIANPLLVPVPLSGRRQRWRGFNQAEVLARVIGKELAIPVVAHALMRTEARRPQVELRSSGERRENVKGAFGPARAAPTLKERDVILVDDVVTSGATMEECARMLKKAKARRIFSLALAQG